MAIRHLNDTEIQDHLDGVTSRENHWTAIHLENCEYCKEQLNHYQSLYLGLKQEVDSSLSANFANSVIAKIQGRSIRFANYKLLTILISIFTLITGSGITFYFTGLKPIFALWNQISIIIKNLNLEWMSTITDFLTGLNLNLSLLGFAILIVLAISTIDRFIMRSKKKLASMFR